MTSFSVTAASPASTTAQATRLFPVRTDSKESFADLLTGQTGKKLSKEELKRRNTIAEQEYIKKRIGEVGLGQFIEEQKEVKKLLKILHLMHAETEKEDVRGRLGEYIEHFEENPPRIPEEILDYIARDIAGIPLDMPNNFRKRMYEAFELMNEMMDFSDQEIERLETAIRQRRK